MVSTVASQQEGCGFESIVCVGSQLEVRHRIERKNEKQNNRNNLHLNQLTYVRGMGRFVKHTVRGEKEIWCKKTEEVEQ